MHVLQVFWLCPFSQKCSIFRNETQKTLDNHMQTWIFWLCCKTPKTAILVWGCFVRRHCVSCACSGAAGAPQLSRKLFRANVNSSDKFCIEGGKLFFWLMFCLHNSNFFLCAYLFYFVLFYSFILFFLVLPETSLCCKNVNIDTQKNTYIHVNRCKCTKTNLCI